MKPLSELRRVPMSRFKREVRRIHRNKEVVCFTKNGKDASVYCPEGSEVFDLLEQHPEVLNK